MRLKFDHCCDIFLKSHVLPAELIISKFSVLKLHTDLNQRVVSETFKKCKMCKSPTVKTEQTDETADKKNANLSVILLIYMFEKKNDIWVRKRGKNIVCLELREVRVRVGVCVCVGGEGGGGGRGGVKQQDTRITDTLPLTEQSSPRFSLIVISSSCFGG